MISPPYIEWESIDFVVNAIVPSKNTSNWKGAKGKMSTKKKWRDIFRDEMIKHDLPCPIPRHEGTPLICIVTMRFGVESRNPEVINYEPVIKECLADALWRSDDRDEQGWIDHDSNDQIRLYVGQMEQRAPSKAHRGMLVELRWMLPREENDDPLDPPTEVMEIEAHEDAPFFSTDVPVAQLPD